MAKKEKKVTWSDLVIFFGPMLGALCLLISLIPFVPWRYSRTDTNIGNRFCVDRSYTLISAGDQFQKKVSWFSLHKKMRQKAEEFGRPNPISALVGTVGSSLGAGGAAMGCATWQICKNHVSARSTQYASIAYTGVTTCVFIFFGMVANVGTIVLQCSESSSKKKSKKKKQSDSWSDQAWTMIASIVAFILPSAGCAAFVLCSDVVLKSFKQTAYYPYAASFVGAYIGGFGCFVNWIVMMLCINRVQPVFGMCCGKGKADSDDEGEAMGAYGQPYGGVPGAAPYGQQQPYYGGQPGQYGQPGAYGEFPGAQAPYGPGAYAQAPYGPGAQGEYRRGAY